MIKNTRLQKQLFTKIFELNKNIAITNHRFFCKNSNNDEAIKDIQVDSKHESIEVQKDQKWEMQDQIASEGLRSIRQQDPIKTQKKLDTKIEIESEDIEKFVHDPRMNEEGGGDYISLDSKSLSETRSKLFSQQQSRIIRADKDSQFSKVVKDGKIDLSNEKIEVEGIDMNNMMLIDRSSIIQNDIAQIDLGKVDVLNKDQVSLEDVSLDSIPANLDIVLNNEKKQAVAIGYFDKNSKDDKNLSTEIFEERSYEEFEKDNLYFLERDSFSQSFKEQSRRLILYSPILLLFIFFLDTCWELYLVKGVNYNMDKSEFKKWRRNLEE